MKQVWKGAMLFLLTLLPFASALAKPSEAGQVRKIIDGKSLTRSTSIGKRLIRPKYVPSGTMPLIIPETWKPIS